MPVPTRPPRQVLDLTLHQDDTNEIAAVIARSTAANSAHVHLSHPHMSLTMGHLLRLHLTLQPNDTHHLPLRVIYHHMHISARAPLILRDRFLNLTMNNTVYTMTPTDTHNVSTRLHCIHLFLDPPTSSPSILYTFDGQPKANPPLSTQRLTITTKLPIPIRSNKRPRRHCMMRTTSHTPTLSKTITFPTKSVQHQMTILTLVAHMLLSAPNLDTTKLSWKAVRQPTTYQQTIGIIMETLALKRYHPIWCTSCPPLLNTDPSAQPTSAPLPPSTPSRSQGITSTSTTLAARATPCKRKHHSPQLTLEEDEDTGQVRIYPP